MGAETLGPAMCRAHPLSGHTFGLDGINQPPAKQQASSSVKGCKDSSTFIRFPQHSWKK